MNIKFGKDLGFAVASIVVSLATMAIDNRKKQKEAEEIAKMVTENLMTYTVKKK